MKNLREQFIDDFDFNRASTEVSNLLTSMIQAPRDWIELKKENTTNGGYIVLCGYKSLKDTITRYKMFNKVTLISETSNLIKYSGVWVYLIRASYRCEMFIGDFINIPIVDIYLKKDGLIAKSTNLLMTKEEEKFETELWKAKIEIE